MSSRNDNHVGRREWIQQAGILVPAVVGLGGISLHAVAAEDPSQDKQEKKEEKKKPTSPTEEMSQEHAMFERVLLVYDEAAMRLAQNGTVPPEVLMQATTLVRSFVDDLHVPMEEELVFPRLEKAGQMESLIAILRKQHAAGRQTGDQMMALLKENFGDNADERLKMAGLIKQYVRMNQAHAAREETEVYPAFRQMLSSNEFDSLHEDMEKREQKQLGSEGPEKLLAQINDLEKKMGLDDISKLIPNLG